MIKLELLKSSGYFKEKTLQKWEILFDEWDIDNNLYYLETGKISIEKYVDKKNNLTKQLAIIHKEDFFWEWALNNSEKKQVKIIGLTESKLLYIDAKEDFLKFMKHFPELAKDILVYIISLTNKRTLDWNNYITSIYEINKSIVEINQINFKEIFKIFDKINKILNWDYLLFLETNPIDKMYLSLKYDTRKMWKIQNKLVKKWKFSLNEIGISKVDKIITKNISIWDEILWNIVIAKKDVFTENQQRIFLGIINSLAWLLKQKNILEEERDIEFSQN